MLSPVLASVIGEVSRVPLRLFGQAVQAGRFRVVVRIAGHGKPVLAYDLPRFEVVPQGFFFFGRQRHALEQLKVVFARVTAARQIENEIAPFGVADFIDEAAIQWILG